MACRYKNECPSYTGLCDGPKQDFSECVLFLVPALENARDKSEVLYECDRRACQSCTGEDCKHTTDIRHAKNFKLSTTTLFVENTDGEVE